MHRLILLWRGEGNRIKTWHVLVLVAALIGSFTGCANYVDAGYGYAPEPVYYEGWYPDADITVFDGDYDRGEDVYAYSRRGYESRGGGRYGGGWHGGGGHYGGGGHGR